MSWIPFVVLAFVQTSAAPAPASSWEALAQEYDQAFERWAHESSLAAGEAEGAPHPAAAYGSRFEALADQGEGRAVLWLLSNLQPGKGAGLLARVQQGGDAEWVGSAVFELGARRGEFDEEDLIAYLEERASHAGTQNLRAYAALALAEVVRAKDAAHAAHLNVWAAMLVHQDVDLAPGDLLAREDADELGGRVLDALEKESRGHFARAYREGADGAYYPISAAPPDPEARWRPVVEELATLGCTRARLWVLGNAPWDLDAAGKERLRGFLETVASESLPEEALQSFGYDISGLVYRLGLDAVEPSVRKLIAASPEEARSGLLFGLGAAVCEAAREDESVRERGLGLLREVRERWPASEDAQRAEGRIFRYTNLVVGKPAPDFETVDADGNAFKLSDYKGKVTVIDFWGFW